MPERARDELTADESAADALEHLVTDFVEGRAKQHVLITGGFGSGKTHALGLAALAAGAGGFRVARLEQGPIGISSYDDFLAAVDGAVSGAAIRPGGTASGETHGYHALAAADTRLVIVIEGLDQLVRQLGATRGPRGAGDPDTPALLPLLDDPDGPMIVGSSITGPLSEEYSERFAVIAMGQVHDRDAGIEIALERAAAQRVLTSGIADRLRAETRSVESALIGNRLFWSTAGSLLGASTRGAVRRAEVDVRRMAKVHFDALLLRVAPSEQRVLLEIARGGAPRTVQEIAEATNVRNQATASALARLFADGWVERIPAPPGTDRRHTWYDIADPLLRMHLRPEGTGSVGDMIREFVDAWRGDPDGESAGMSVEALAEGDREATLRGESGSPDIARTWFKDALLARLERDGLRSPDVAGTYWAWAVWTGQSGDRQRAQRMLLTSIEDADALFGAESLRAIEAKNHAAWNLMEMGAFDEAQAIYESLIVLAERSGDRANEVRVRQDLGRALGEQGDTVGAQEQMTVALAQMAELAREAPEEARAGWREAIRRSAHGLAYWTAAGGDLGHAVARLNGLLEDPETSTHDRNAIMLERCRIIATASPERAVVDFQSLAVEIEASGIDGDLAQEARNAAFVLATRAWPDAPSRWPVDGADVGIVSDRVAELLDEGTLGLQGLALLLGRASSPQVRALPPRLVASPRALPRGRRSAIARTVAPYLHRSAEQRLVADLAGALDRDPLSEANLPEEWRDALAAMRDADEAGETNK